MARSGVSVCGTVLGLLGLWGCSSTAGGPVATTPTDGGVTRDSGVQTDAGVGDALPPQDAGPDSPLLDPAPLCDSKGTWRADVKLSTSTASDDRFGSVTPDELTIAWALDTGGAIEVRVADRASPSDAFGAGQTAVTGVALDRTALSPNGLKLVVVNGDRKGFAQLSRATRSDAFTPSVASPFEALDGVLLADELYGDPILAPDDHSFFYSRHGGGRTETIHVSNRVFTSDPWGPGGSLVSAPELAATPTTRRRPTAMSSDGRTLFFFDEVTQKQRAGWFRYNSLDFESFVDLGARVGATPNAACTRLYFSNAGDLQTADRN